MPKPQAPLAAAQNLLRAERHRLNGEAKVAAGDEWGAVALFYSAYHLVRAALDVDPIWMDAPARMRLSLDLTPAERHTVRHHGGKRVGGRVWGVNDLVHLLYPGIQSAYERLHLASIDVRYQMGFPPGDLSSLLAPLTSIRACSDQGQLVAPR